MICTYALSLAAPTPTTVVGNDQFFSKFILADNGVLYENPVMQIGAKCEFHSRVGRVSLFYGNRGAAPFTNVLTRITHVQHPGSIVHDAVPLQSCTSTHVGNECFFSSLNHNVQKYVT